MVMATGIVAVAALQQDLDLSPRPCTSSPPRRTSCSPVLLIARVVLLPGCIRRRRRPATPRASRSSPSSPAPTCSAAASGIIHGWWDLAWALWCAEPRAVGGVHLHHAHLRRDPRRTSRDSSGGINGTWFLLTVSTESIAVVAGTAARRAHDSDLLAFVGARRVHAWHRALPHRDDDGVPALDVPSARPDRSRPARLDRRRRRRHHRARRLQPARWRRRRRRGSTGWPRSSRGWSCMAWATATFWFPLMIAIGIWRHLIRKRPAAVPPRLLVARVPPRHVRRRDLPHARRDRSRRTRLASESDAGVLVDGVVVDRVWTRTPRSLHAWPTPGFRR